MNRYTNRFFLIDIFIIVLTSKIDSPKVSYKLILYIYIKILLIKKRNMFHIKKKKKRKRRNLFFIVLKNLELTNFLIRMSI